MGYHKTFSVYADIGERLHYTIQIGQAKNCFERARE